MKRRPDGRIPLPRARLLLVCAAWTAVLCALPRVSLGWGNTWLGMALEQSLKAARGTLGPFRYEGAFQIGNIGYDSDIYFGQGLKTTPDYVFNAGPIVSLYLPVSRHVVIDLFDNPRYVFFLRTRNERTLNNSFRSQVHVDLNRLYFLVGGGLNNFKERLSSELNLRIRRSESDLGGLVFWQISKGSAVSLQYRDTAFAYENPPAGNLKISENLNRNERFVKLSGYLFQDARKRGFVEAEYGSYVFDRAHSGLKDYRSYTIYGGVEFAPAPEGEEFLKGFQGSLNLGYQRFEFPEVKGKTHKGLVGNTNVSAKLARFTTVFGRFSRNIQFSAYASQDAFIQTALGGGFSQIFSRRISLVYDFASSRNDYLTDAGEDVLGLRPRTYRTHSFALFFTIGESVRLDITASLDQWRSQASARYRRNTIGLGLRFGSSTGGNRLNGRPNF